MDYRAATVRGRLLMGAVAGVIAPALFALTVLTVTLADWSFLSSYGWSAVHRTPVEWPSVLMLGPRRWVVIGAFLACGLLGIAFAAALQTIAPTRRARIGALFIGLLSVALCLEAFPPDHAPATTASWHDTIHGWAYPLIPLASVGATASLAWGLRGVRGWDTLVPLSLVTLAVITPAIAVTAGDELAQLARYFFFGPLTVWLEALALIALRNVRAGAGGDGEQWPLSAEERAGEAPVGA
jgi:hypothetical protein